MTRSTLSDDWMSLIRMPLASMSQVVSIGRARRGALEGVAPVRVECLDLAALTQRQAAWRDLAARSLDANVFLHPEFALPLAQHGPVAERPLFVVATDNGRMIGLMAVHVVRGGLARTWSPALAALGAPLLDQTRAGLALDLMLDWLARERGAVGLLVGAVERDGPLAALLQERARARGLATRVFDQGARAILTAATGDAEAAMSNHRRRNLRRQRRLLEAQGTLQFTTASTCAAVRDATERFLDLEGRGWKGRRGTALVNAPWSATFTRAMLRSFAAEGRVRVHTLTLDDKPIAMGVTLHTDTRAFFWKIAYREDMATFSPGVLLTLDISRALLAENVGFVDSCAVPDHPMIDRVWPERMAMIDVAVSLGRGSAFGRAVWFETRRRALRSAAKAALQRLRSR